jgi:hypothetical protein
MIRDPAMVPAARRSPRHTAQSVGGLRPKEEWDSAGLSHRLLHHPRASSAGREAGIPWRLAVGTGIKAIARSSARLGRTVVAHDKQEGMGDGEGVVRLRPVGQARAQGLG